MGFILILTRTLPRVVTHISRILRKALHERILVEVLFAGFFLVKVRYWTFVCDQAHNYCSSSENKFFSTILPLWTLISISWSYLLQELYGKHGGFILEFHRCYREYVFHVPF